MTKNVSILLPVFNREAYLPSAIESVLAQTYERFELLISDNCSTDSSFDIATKYARVDNRVKLSQNSQNIGCGPNYNKLILQAAGDYTHIFGSDDILEPACVERLVESLNANPSAVVSTGARRILDSNNQLVKEIRPFSTSKLIGGEDARRQLLVTLDNWIGMPVMWRTEHTGTGFNCRLFQLVDLEYWCRLLDHGDIFYVNEVLMSYREHEESQSMRNLKDLSIALDIVRIYDCYSDILRVPGTPDEFFEQQIAQRLFDFANFFINNRHYKFDDLLVPSLCSSANSEAPELSRAQGDAHDFRRIAGLLLSQIASQLDSYRNAECEREKLKNQVTTLENEIRSLRNSTSWRITAPLRRVSAGLRPSSEQ